ncbi:DUF302 domain-containing protein [Marinobacter sp. F4216]|uniref:DUF302 domain-containing protein n=1 Tax=Marinobacter sp. F4216 TaxID=2874281 RepID=UPI001CBD380A|nr:DUF302 domain-containing protein [Marinobacter sp. F4216]MBZ2169488.1 DUF302 domain-containing protein [Marinobacter sp. F4216]
MTLLRKLVFVVSALLLSGLAQAADGLIAVKSNHSVSDTTERLVAALQDKGMMVMNRIDHAAGAGSVGAELRPTEVVIFGNPKVGTPLMQCAQSVAVDLPQKALIWEDNEGQVWLGYNDPAYLKARHGIEGCDEVLAKVEAALDNFASMATR